MSINPGSSVTFHRLNTKILMWRCDSHWSPDHLIRLSKQLKIVVLTIAIIFHHSSLFMGLKYFVSEDRGLAGPFKMKIRLPGILSILTLIVFGSQPANTAPHKTIICLSFLHLVKDPCAFSLNASISHKEKSGFTSLWLVEITSFLLLVGQCLGTLCISRIAIMLMGDINQ